MTKEISNGLAGNWNDLPDIDDATAAGEADAPLFEELRQVLKKHGALDRFGITLLHKHFDVADDEVLMEYCDRSKKELLIKPVKVIGVDVATTTETSWRLSEDGEVCMGKCTLRCAKDEDGFHPKRHWPS